MAYYHAGPEGLAELRTLRELFEDGIYSEEQIESMWYAKWGDYPIMDLIWAHPTVDEISLTTDLEEAKGIAKSIGGCVYRVECEIRRINEEGYPVTLKTDRIEKVA